MGKEFKKMSEQPVGLIIESNRSHENRPLTLFMVIYDFVVLWYFFMGGSILLRPMAALVWGGLAGIGFFVFKSHKIIVNGYLMRCVLMILIIALSVLYSENTMGSLKYVFSIIIYLTIAYHLTRLNTNIEFIISAIRFFLLFLLIITYIQKFAPDFYLTSIIGFLPVKYHESILLFMHNKSCNGFFNQTSSNALMLSLGVCTYWYFYNIHKLANSFLSLIDLLMMVCFYYGVALTNRRGPMIILLVFFGILLYTSDLKATTKIGFTIVGLVLLISGILRESVLFVNLFSKFNATLVAGDVSDGRYRIWTDSLSLFLARPLTGIGIDSLIYSIHDIDNAHNSYLQSLLELGIIGSFFYYLPFVYALNKTVKVYVVERRNATIKAALISFCMLWQVYCFSYSLVEAFFSSEASVFTLFIVQIIGIDLWLSEEML